VRYRSSRPTSGPTTRHAKRSRCRSSTAIVPSMEGMAAVAISIFQVSEHSGAHQSSGPLIACAGRRAVVWCVTGCGPHCRSGHARRRDLWPRACFLSMQVQSSDNLRVGFVLILTLLYVHGMGLGRADRRRIPGRCLIRSRLALLIFSAARKPAAYFASTRRNGPMCWGSSRSSEGPRGLTTYWA